MSNLQNIPAFGFETKKWHDEKLTQLLANHTSSEKSIVARLATSWKGRNIIKGVSCIPIIGSFIGLHELYVVSEAPKEIFPNKTSWIIRGTITSLSLGFLLLVPDLILACYNNSREQKNDTDNNKIDPNTIKPISVNKSESPSPDMPTINKKTIGTQEKPLNKEQIQTALSELYNDPSRSAIDALIIYGNGNVEFSTDPGIIALNPKKLILVGAKIVNKHDVEKSRNFEEPFVAALLQNYWLNVGVAKSSDPRLPETLVKQILVKSVEEALAHQPPFIKNSQEPYHAIYIAPLATAHSS